MRFGFIGDALEWVLRYIYEYVPNYAIAVLIFTVLIHVLLLPLDVKSKRSMMGMARVQPQIDALKKKYEKDPEKLNRKMTELYRQEKISPMGGCLPLLLRLPILFAMFAVMNDIAQEGTVLQLLDIKKNLDAGITDYQPALQSFLWIKNVLQADSLFATVMPAAVSSADKALMGYGTTSQVTAEMLTAAREFLASEGYATWATAYGNQAWYRGTLLMWTITIPAVFNGWCILPPLSAVCQYLATKYMSVDQAKSQNGNQPDTGKFMKYFFPIFSLFICFTSNAVFALYWVSSSVVQTISNILVGKWVTYSDAKKASKEEQQA